MKFANVSLEDHEKLAAKLGIGVAGELLLLHVAHECGSDESKWQDAKALGIPWLKKNWTNLHRFMDDYNAAVERVQPSIAHVDPNMVAKVSVASSSDSESRGWRPRPRRHSASAASSCSRAQRKRAHSASCDPTRLVPAPRRKRPSAPGTRASAWKAGDQEDSCPPPRRKHPSAPGKQAYQNLQALKINWPRIGGHIDKKTFDDLKLRFQSMAGSRPCKFSDRPRYEVSVERPNFLNIEWLYSVPCGEKKVKGRVRARPGCSFVSRKTSGTFTTGRCGPIPICENNTGWQSQTPRTSASSVPSACRTSAIWKKLSPSPRMPSSRAHPRCCPFGVIPDAAL